MRGPENLRGRERLVAALYALGFPLLRLESHEGIAKIDVPVALHPGELKLSLGSDVVVLAVKTQHVLTALQDLSAVAPAELPVVCVQNGVEAERLALRRFESIQSVCVMVPAVYLEPRLVQAFAKPITGVLDVGRYPRGRNELTERLATGKRVAAAALQRARAYARGAGPRVRGGVLRMLEAKAR